MQQDYNYRFVTEMAHLVEAGLISRKEFRAWLVTVDTGFGRALATVNVTEDE